MKEILVTGSIRNTDAGGHAPDPFQGRAVLRAYSVEDGAAVIEVLEDPEVVRWLAALPVPVDPEAAEKYLTFLNDPDVIAQTLWVDDNLAGVISLGTELSFWIKAAFHNTGLGTWAVAQFLHLLPAKQGRVTACCMQSNLAAKAVLQKLEFEPVGDPFRRFSFAHERAVTFLRFERQS